MEKKRESLAAEVEQAESELLRALEKRLSYTEKIRELSLTLDPVERRIARVETSSRMVSSAMAELLHRIAGAENPLRIAVASAPGSTGWLVAEERYSAMTMVEAQGEGAIEEVLRKRCDISLVPLESRALGCISWAISSLYHSDLKIQHVIEREESLDAFSFTGNIRDVERIYSTSRDRASAGDFLVANLPKASFIEVASPRVAAELASEDHGAVALVAHETGVRQNLKLIERQLQKGRADRTRYAFVSHRLSAKTGRDVTAIAFALIDVPGALLDALKPFSERGINVSRLHSQPEGGADWAYLFYAECDGHATDRSVVSALDELKKRSRTLKSLGSFAVGPTPT